MSYCFIHSLKKALTIIVISSFMTNSIFSINVCCINKEILQEIKNKNGVVNENVLKNISNQLYDVFLNIKKNAISWCQCENAPAGKHFNLAAEIIRSTVKKYDTKKKLVITNFAEEGCLDPYIIIAGLLGAEFSQITCNLIGKNNTLIKKCENLTKELQKYLGENFEIIKPSDNIFEIKDSSNTKKLTIRYFEKGFEPYAKGVLENKYEKTDIFTYIDKPHNEKTSDSNLNPDEDESITSIKFFNNNDFRSQVILSWQPKASLFYEIKFMALPETLTDSYNFIKNSLWQNVTMEELSEKIKIGLNTWNKNETIIKCIKFILSGSYKKPLESCNLLDHDYWSKNFETWKNFIQELDNTIKKINESSKKNGVLYFRSYLPQKEMQEIQTKQDMLKTIYNLAQKHNVPYFPINSISTCADNDFYELVNLTSNDKASNFLLNGGSVTIWD